MHPSSPEPREIQFSEHAIRDALQRDGFSVYPGAVLPARQVPPDFVPINVDDLPEIEEYHLSDEPPRMLRREEMDEWGMARRRPEPQPRSPRKNVCLGARPRASRGRPIRRRGSRRTSAPQQILTRDEVLVLLSEKARDGSTSAMIALERALRLHRPEDDELDAELDRLLEQGD